jgi:putative ABC transport system permease protein
VEVSPEYFGLLGLTLLQGRLFDERDGRAGDPVVVVDRTWARRFFPSGNAVGQRLHEGGCTTCPWTTVIGVVSDVKYDRLDTVDQGAVYTPMPARGFVPPEQATSRFRYLMLRTSSKPATVLRSVRQVLRDLDPSLPLSEVATTEALVADALKITRALSLLVASLAVVSLLLSTVGIYGVMAYYVQSRAKEIGIRMALGGRPADVLRLVAAQGMKTAAVGIVVGVLLALALTRLVAGLLFQVSPTDVSAFARVASLSLAAGLLACCLPAVRAVGVGPAVVLRDE